MIEISTIKKYIKEFKNKKVLIIGDVMVDAYMWGKVNRISPEAPIPIVSVRERDYRLGGAANVALNVSALGAEAILCSVIGKDEKGEVFCSLLKNQNLSSEGIIKSNNRRTTVKTRIISNGQHLLRVDEEDSHTLDSKHNSYLLEKITYLVNKYEFDVIIFEDYDKGVLNKVLINQITKLAKDKKIFTAVDPKRNNFLDYKNCNLFKPNLKEFSEGINANIKNSNITKLESSASQFISEQNIDILLITLSEKGVFIADKKEMLHFPAEIRDISDVSGAGDTVISIASLLLASGANLSEIAQIANIAGGIVCEKTGVVPINPNELFF